MSDSPDATLSRRAFLRLTAGGLAATGAASLLAACGGGATPAAPTTAPPAAPTSPPPVAPTTAPPAAPATAAVAPTVAAAPTAAPAAPPAAPTSAPDAATTAPTAAPAAAASGDALRWWWWGEQEAPGLEAWVNQSVEMYKASSGVTIETTLQDTAVVISQFQTAAAAQDAPDIQFLWNGIYHMESVWLGYLEPLNGLIPDDLLASSNATVLSQYDGKQWRVGWYAVPMIWLYNKEMFSQAGLNAEQPPRTFDELLNACDKLKAKGFTPIVGGLKDGFWGEWQMGHGLTSYLDSPAEALNLFSGNLDWREPKYHDHWAKTEALWKAGYINDDMLSIDLYPGIDLFAAGKGAMTSAVGPLVPKVQKGLGDKVAPFIYPGGGSGKMANRPIADTQGIGISAQAKNKEQAADFLKFLHTPERLPALYDSAKQLPADTTWDGKGLTDPALKSIWMDWMKGGDSLPYISNLMPTLFWTDAMFVNAQKIVSGEYNAQQAADNAQAVAQKWREQNPDLLEKYAKWANDLKL